MYQIEFTEEELNFALETLSHKPYREVAGLISNIHQQIQKIAASRAMANMPVDTSSGNDVVAES